MANLLKFRRLWMGVTVSLGILAIAPVALAQSAEDLPTEDPAATESTPLSPTTLPSATTIAPNGGQVVDPNAGFGGTEASQGLFGEGRSPFELIHRAVLMNETSMSDFSRQHQNRMMREAEAFRMMQQEAIRNGSAQEAPAAQ